MTGSDHVFFKMDLSDPSLLQTYYSRIFPYSELFDWIYSGDSSNFVNREFAFTCKKKSEDEFIRYLSFSSIDQFKNELVSKIPIQIDMGGIYRISPKHKPHFANLEPLQKELIFDIDINDYDKIRVCCRGSDICKKCWRFMAIACRIIDETLRLDFGFEELLWVFSGRRGIHCWVSDEKARILSNSQRRAIVSYLRFGNIKNRSQSPHWRRSLNIIDKYFINIVSEQDILGTPKQVTRFEKFLNVEDKNAKKIIMDAILEAKTSLERWNAFENAAKTLELENLLGRMKLFFAYPKLDADVSALLNHLLKIPFCVHSKSKKISVPFNIENVEDFNIDAVPTLQQLVEELEKHNEEFEEEEHPKDYTFTSLGPFVEIIRKKSKPAK